MSKQRKGARGERCKKQDHGSAGAGCIKPAGHRAHCKIRPHPQSLFDAGDDGGPPPSIRARLAAGGSKSPRVATRGHQGAGAGGAQGLARVLREIEAVNARIATAVGELLAECQGTLDSVGEALQRVKSRNDQLLKGLCQSRRDVAQLRQTVKAHPWRRVGSQATEPKTTTRETQP